MAYIISSADRSSDLLRRHEKSAHNIETSRRKKRRLSETENGDDLARQSSNTSAAANTPLQSAAPHVGTGYGMQQSPTALPRAQNPPGVPTMQPNHVAFAPQPVVQQIHQAYQPQLPPDQAMLGNFSAYQYPGKSFGGSRQAVSQRRQRSSAITQFPL